MTKINPNNLKRGDILLTHRADGPKHTAIYCGENKLVHASLNEKGGIYGGKTGDQTGREICIRDYYDKPWDFVLRYPDSVLADEYTKKAEEIARDDSHGYDQIHRQGPDYDCSSLVVHCVDSVGIPVRRYSSYTGDMKAGFLKCGFVLVDTNAPVASPDASKTSGDTIHVVTKGENLTQISKRYGVSIEDILKANPFIKNPNKIYIGDKLLIKGKTPKGSVIGTVKTRGADLNIRAGKGTNYKIIGTLKNGEKVEVDTTGGEWLKLTGRAGYVSATYILL